MPDQAQLAILSRHLATAIADLERTQPKHRHPGGAGFPSHTALVSDPPVVRLAAVRMLVWAAWLRHRVPTRESVERALHRLRGSLLYGAALQAHKDGKPLPLKAGIRPPTWALKAKHAPTRASTPKSPPPDPPKPPTNAEQGYSVVNDPTDPVDWWDAYGEMAPLDTDPDISSLDWMESQVVADMAGSFAFADFLMRSSTRDAILSDYQVMQLLEGYWNGQAALFSGKQFGDLAGIAGTFDMQDPKVDWFFRAQAGNFLSAIDQTTRQQLASVLADSYGQGRYLDGMVRDIAPILQNAMGVLDAAAIAKSLSRAEMIAVTETARAQTFGTLISMLEAGVQRKIWQVTDGACIYCEENQEQGDIPITDQFPSGAQAPPGHPKCRCSVAAWRPDTFDPSQWQYTPNPDLLLSTFFENPDLLANWPSVDLPDMNVPPEDLSPLAQRYPDLGLLQFSDLPQGLQDVLTPAALSGLTQDLGSAITDIASESVGATPSSFDDFMSRFAGLQEAFKTLEQAQVPPSTPLNILPEVLAQLPTEVVPQQDIEAALEQVTEYTDAEQQMIDRMRSNLDDILADFRSSLEESGDETGE